MTALCSRRARLPPPRRPLRTIQTVPGGAGHALLVDGIAFQADAAGRAQPPVYGRRLAARADDPDRARRASSLRPLVRRPQDRRGEPRVPGRLPLRRPERKPGRPAGGQRRSPWPAATAAATCSRARSPAGCRGTASWRERREEVDRGLVCGRGRPRRGLDGRAPRDSSASFPARAAGCNCGCCCSRPASRYATRCSASRSARRSSWSPERQGRAAGARPGRRSSRWSRCPAATTA